MGNSKFIVLFISLLSVSVLALPNVVSMFAGQHYWYDLTDEVNDVPCEKCHADVAEEMSVLISAHTGETTGQRFKCEYCHRIFPITDNGLMQSQNVNETIYQSYLRDFARAGQDAVPGKDAHAASTIACLYCHSGQSFTNTILHSGGKDCTECGCHEGGHGHDSSEYFSVSDCENCHQGMGWTALYQFPYDPNNVVMTYTEGIFRIPPAGGFNWTANTSDTGQLAAHKSFIEESIKDKTLEHCNEACIACHTSTAVKINWQHARSIEFDIGLEEQLITRYGVHNWSVGNWKYNGTASSTVWGNTVGEGSTSLDDIEFPGNINGMYAMSSSIHPQSSNQPASPTPTPYSSTSTSNIGNAVDNDELTWSMGGDGFWSTTYDEYYKDGDSIYSALTGDSVWVSTTVEGPGKVKFYWKVDMGNSGYIQFYVDGGLVKQKGATSIFEPLGWSSVSQNVGDSSHTLSWVYRDSSGSGRGYLDYVQFIPK